MSNKIIKCNECGKVCEPSLAKKGPNNTYLCGGDWRKGPGVCGNNVCFKCGKVETRTKWVEDEDCCGNKIMKEQKVSIFKQVERDENDPDMELWVCYCDEHEEEGKKSPLLWTKTDDERIERQKEEEKQEIEEKLGSQKGLFYVIDPFSRAVEGKRIEGIEYGCVYFWGKENGQNFYLLVPDTHPVLNDFKYKKKSELDGRELEYTCYNLERQFYLVKEVDNLPLKANPQGEYKGDDPAAKAKNFYKVAELDHKIEIIPYEVETNSELSKKEIKDCDICRKNEKEMDNGTEKWYNLRRYHGQKNDVIHACSNCYKNKEQEYLQNYESIFTFPTKDLTHEGVPFNIETIKRGKTDCYAGQKDQNGKVLQQQNCPHCQPWKQHENNNELDTNSLLQLFQKNKIKRIVWDKNKKELFIEFEQGGSDLAENTSELDKIKSYLTKNGKNQISLSELMKNTNSNPTKRPQDNDNKALLWYSLGGGLLVIGIITWLALKRKRVRKN